MILLARTTPVEDVRTASSGLSVFLVEMRDETATHSRPHDQPDRDHDEPRHHRGLLRRLRDPRRRADRREGNGLPSHPRRHERRTDPDRGRVHRRRPVLAGAGAAYANERQVFGRPIGANQGVQFPLARAYTNLEAANLMRWKAADPVRPRQPCGAEANMAKNSPPMLPGRRPTPPSTPTAGSALPPSTTSSANSREPRLYQVRRSTTISSWPSSAQKCLGLPKSY